MTAPAASSVIANWDPEQVAGFERKVIAFRHSLHERPMFSDEGLASILHRYPRQALGVFTMGEDLEDWQSWRRGGAGAMSGERLLEAVKQGRLWLNLRHANTHLLEFTDVCREISAEKEKAFGTRVLNRDLGLLISSPKARVFYHLDVPLSSLWQVRARSRSGSIRARSPMCSRPGLSAVCTRRPRARCPSPPPGTKPPKPAS